MTEEEEKKAKEAFRKNVSFLRKKTEPKIPEEEKISGNCEQTPSILFF